MDNNFLKEMQVINNQLIAPIEIERKEHDAETCEDTMFCKSLISVMKGLSLKKED